MRLGIAQDLRGEEAVREQLARRRREYEALPDWQRPYYDQERFRNPYGDVRLVFAPVPPEQIEVRSIVLGIDIHLPELLLADRLRQEGPAGGRGDRPPRPRDRASASLSWDTMPFLVDLLALEGVPRADAEACIHPYIEGKLRDLEDFHRVGPDMARLLGLPLGCIHTPADYYITVGVRAAVEAGPAGDGGGRGAGPAHVTGGRLLRPPGGGGAGDERGRGPPRRAHPVQVRRGLRPPSRGLPLARRGRGQHRAADRLQPARPRRRRRRG